MPGFVPVVLTYHARGLCQLCSLIMSGFVPVVLTYHARGLCQGIESGIRHLPVLGCGQQAPLDPVHAGSDGLGHICIPTPSHW
eukprot:1195606-Prorocentrum_minimum.AAC.2